MISTHEPGGRPSCCRSWDIGVAGEGLGGAARCARPSRAFLSRRRGVVKASGCWRIARPSTKLAAMNLRIVLLSGFALVVGAAVFALQPGSAAVSASLDGGSGLAGDFVLDADLGPDSVRLMRGLSVLAHDSMRGRAPGTRGSARARSFIVSELAAADVQPIGDVYDRDFRLPDGGSATNIIGIVPGTSDRVIVLTAHYDHVGVRDGEIFNGADDNASGTAAVLEIARLVVMSPLESTLVVALLDAEEVGLQGARAFVRTPPIAIERIALNVNLDMVARSDGLLWASGASHTPALRPLLEAVADDAPVTLRLGHDRPDAPEGDDWTHSSDHGPFHDAGIPFIYFGVEDHADYHRSTDDYERVVPGDFVNSVRTILAALRAVDTALPLSAPQPAP